jgi:ParB-like chromosome segregation protein Spo0J
MNYALTIEHHLPANLRPYARNAPHALGQTDQTDRPLDERFGFTNPVLISDDREIVAGHGRVEAARLLGLATVPTLRLSHLSETQRRAYVLADNKLAQNAGWDREVLAIELQPLVALDFDVKLTGFSIAETDLIIEEARESSPQSSTGPDDELSPPTEGVPVTRLGDLWQLGRHLHTRSAMASRRSRLDSRRVNRAIRRGGARRPYAEIEDLFMREYLRPVKVREGDRVQTMPAIQVIMRAEISKGVKGSGPAQRSALRTARQIGRDWQARHEACCKQRSSSRWRPSMNAPERSRRAELPIRLCWTRTPLRSISPQET